MLAPRRTEKQGPAPPPRFVSLPGNETGHGAWDSGGLQLLAGVCLVNLLPERIP